MNPTPLNVVRRPVAGPMRKHVSLTSCNGCPSLGTLTLNSKEGFVCEDAEKRVISCRTGDYILTPEWCPVVRW